MQYLPQGAEEKIPSAKPSNQDAPRPEQVEMVNQGGLKNVDNPVQLDYQMVRQDNQVEPDQVQSTDQVESDNFLCVSKPMDQSHCQLDHQEQGDNVLVYQDDNLPEEKTKAVAGDQDEAIQDSSVDLESTDEAQPMKEKAVGHAEHCLDQQDTPGDKTPAEVEMEYQDGDTQETTQDSNKGKEEECRTQDTTQDSKEGKEEECQDEGAQDTTQDSKEGKEVESKSKNERREVEPEGSTDAIEPLTRAENQDSHDADQVALEDGSLIAESKEQTNLLSDSDDQDRVTESKEQTNLLHESNAEQGSNSASPKSKDEPKESAESEEVSTKQDTPATENSEVEHHYHHMFPMRRVHTLEESPLPMHHTPPLPIGHRRSRPHNATLIPSPPLTYPCGGGNQVMLVAPATPTSYQHGEASEQVYMMSSPNLSGNLSPSSQQENGNQEDGVEDGNQSRSEANSYPQSYYTLFVPTPYYTYTVYNPK